MAKSNAKDIRRAKLTAMLPPPGPGIARLQELALGDGAMRKAFALGGLPAFDPQGLAAWRPPTSPTWAMGGADSWAPASTYPIHTPPPVTGTPTTPGTGGAGGGHDPSQLGRQVLKGGAKWAASQALNNPATTAATTSSTLGPADNSGAFPGGGGPSQGPGQSTSTGSYAGEIGQGGVTGPGGIGMSPGMMGMGYGLATGQAMSPGFAAASLGSMATGPAGMATGLLGMGLNALGFRGSTDPHALSGNADSASDKGADKAGFAGMLGDPGTKDADVDADFAGADMSGAMGGVDTGGHEAGHGDMGGYGGDMGGGAESDADGGSDSDGGGGGESEGGGDGSDGEWRGGRQGRDSQHPAASIPGIHVRVPERVMRADGGEIPGIVAYHGSPHDFPAEREIEHPTGEVTHVVGAPGVLPEPPQGAKVRRDYPLGRFRDDKIGTGEGAQAYGHGHYLAEREGVARDYRRMLSKGPPGRQTTILNGKPVEDLFPEAPQTIRALIAGALIQNNGDVDETLRSWKSRGTQLSMRAHDFLAPYAGQRAELPPDPGHLYQARIRAHPEHFLDWDKPLSEQHPKVQEIAQQVASSSGMKARKLGADAKGSHLWESMRSPVPAKQLGYENWSTHGPAKYLAAAGIPGIRYLDQGSRGKGDGTRNYVVFDPSLIEIEKKYRAGGPVHRADGGEIAPGYVFDPANIFGFARGGAIDRALRLAYQAGKNSHVPSR